MLQLSFVNFRKDSYILVEGKKDNDRFYIIKSGKVRCFKSNDPMNISVKELTVGDFIGVIPCMSSHNQIENAVAVTDVVCISVRKDQYPELIEKNTPVALKIIKTFANRMRALNETLTQLAFKNVSLETTEHIFEVAEYYDLARKYDIAAYAYYRYLKECPQGINFDAAKKRLSSLKNSTNAVHFEPTSDLTRFYPKGTMIFSESQNGPDMFVIQEGQVSISKVVDGKEVVLAVLSRGDMFGEMALLENKLRSASAIAHEDCKLMVINRLNFDQMVCSQPQLIARLTTTLSERMWATYRQLDNTNLKDSYQKLIDMLSLQIEKIHKYSGSYKTELTIEDLVNMCAIPKNQQASVKFQFYENAPVKFIENKIFIPDCLEILKQAAIYRKQNFE